RSFGGQSARAGGATFYAGLGISEDIIMGIGRWSSSAWRIYVRDNPTVRAALHHIVYIVKMKIGGPSWPSLAAITLNLHQVFDEEVSEIADSKVFQASTSI
ncbi:hypothetical protein H0H92_011682, partial [Tricholoma furcatifolium]